MYQSELGSNKMRLDIFISEDHTLGWASGEFEERKPPLPSERTKANPPRTGLHSILLIYMLLLFANGVAAKKKRN